MMRRVRALLGLLVGALIAGLVAGTPGGHSAAAAPAPQVVPQPLRAASTQVLLEVGLVKEVNKVRARVGCPALVPVSPLRIAARRHSTLMARRLQLSHRLPGELTLARRTAAAGYTGPTLLGEVLAVGPRAPYDVVQVWLRSSPHRALLTDCRFRHIGAGVAGSSDRRRWWTVDLGRR